MKQLKISLQISTASRLTGSNGRVVEEGGALCFISYWPKVCCLISLSAAEVVGARCWGCSNGGGVLWGRPARFLSQIYHPWIVKKVKSLSRVRLFAIPWTGDLPGFSVHGIFQARVLEWIAISFSRESSWPRDRTQFSCTAGRRFTLWTVLSKLYHWRFTHYNISVQAR